MWRAWDADAQASAADVVAEANRADGLRTTFPASRDSLRARSARVLSLAPRVVEGDTPAAAAATLSSLISAAAADAGVRLGAVQPRSDVANARGSPEGAAVARQAFVHVSVHGDLTGDVVGLAQFVSELDGARPCWPCASSRSLSPTLRRRRAAWKCCTPTLRWSDWHWRRACIPPSTRRMVLARHPPAVYGHDGCQCVRVSSPRRFLTPCAA